MVMDSSTSYHDKVDVMLITINGNNLLPPVTPEMSSLADNVQKLVRVVGSLARRAAFLISDGSPTLLRKDPQYNARVKSFREMFRRCGAPVDDMASFADLAMVDPLHCDPAEVATMAPMVLRCLEEAPPTPQVQFGVWRKGRLCPREEGDFVMEQHSDGTWNAICLRCGIRATPEHMEAKHNSSLDFHTHKLLGVYLPNKGGSIMGMLAFHAALGRVCPPEAFTMLAGPTNEGIATVEDANDAWTAPEWTAQVRQFQQVAAPAPAPVAIAVPNATPPVFRDASDTCAHADAEAVPAEQNRCATGDVSPGHLMPEQFSSPGLSEEDIRSLGSSLLTRDGGPQPFGSAGQKLLSSGGCLAQTEEPGLPPMATCGAEGAGSEAPVLVLAGRDVSDGVRFTRDAAPARTGPDELDSFGRCSDGAANVNEMAGEADCEATDEPRLVRPASGMAKTKCHGAEQKSEAKGMLPQDRGWRSGSLQALHWTGTDSGGWGQNGNVQGPGSGGFDGAVEHRTGPKKRSCEAGIEESETSPSGREEGVLMAWNRDHGQVSRAEHRGTLPLQQCDITEGDPIVGATVSYKVHRGLAGHDIAAWAICKQLRFASGPSA